MKRSTPSKEAVVTTATPLASMPLEPVITETAKAKAAEGAEKETPPFVVLEPEVATEEQPAPQKAKAIEEEATESPAVVEVSEKASSSRAQEAAKSPTSEAIELVVSDVQRLIHCHPLNSRDSFRCWSKPTRLVCFSCFRVIPSSSSPRGLNWLVEEIQVSSFA